MSILATGRHPVSFSLSASVFALFLSGCLGLPLADMNRDGNSDKRPTGDDWKKGFPSADELGTDNDSETEAGGASRLLLFQMGDEGYDSAVDIEIRREYPDISHPSNQTLKSLLPFDSSDVTETAALMRFNDIFGAQEGRIPTDAVIARASLVVWGTGRTEDRIHLHRMLVDWSSDSTWNSLYGGVSLNDSEALVAADAWLPSNHTAGQFYSFDVTASLSAWQRDPPSNFGWIVRADGPGGFELASSEYVTPALRHLLEVELFCDDGPSVELEAPNHGAAGLPGAATLEVTVADLDGGALDLAFFGRRQEEKKWTLIALPDTQYYTNNPAYNEIFISQTQWIVENRDELNIQMVVHEGDIIHNPEVMEQWEFARSALQILVDEGIPFSVVPGNHDHTGWQREGDTYLYAATFPSSDFEVFSWREESSDFNDNSNNFVALTIGNEKYIFVALDFCPFPDEIDWANEVLYAHPDHKAILTTHSYIRDTDGAYTGTSCADTSYIFDDLVDRHDNLRIVLCGHMHAGDGEYYRPDYNSNDNLVHQLVADYQDRENGGNGRLRIMTFDPNTDTIHVQTYSPYTGFYETDADSDFTFPYEMEGGSSFSKLGEVGGVRSGGSAKLKWSGLEPGATYEWYVVVTGTEETTVSLVWAFATVEIE